LTLVTAHKDKLLSVLCNRIHEKFKHKLTTSQLSSWLKAQGLVWKKVCPFVIVANLQFQREAREHDPVLRAAWLRKLAQYRAEQLVFLDESGFNSRTGEATHGWAKKGEVIRQTVSGPKSENYSLLSAMIVDGYIALTVHQGPIYLDAFRDFIQDQVLLLCTPYPGLRSVIIIDNATIHNVLSLY